MEEQQHRRLSTTSFSPLPPPPPLSFASSLPAHRARLAQDRNAVDCALCDFVGAELDCFDRRRRRRKALSLAGGGVASFADAAGGSGGAAAEVPAVVRSISAHTLRAASVLVGRLLAVDRGQLEAAFAGAMRPCGALTKPDFVGMLRETTGASSAAHLKEILELHDFLDRQRGGVDYVSFFSYLAECETPSAPLEQLSAMWAYLRKCKHRTGYVSRYEWETLLLSAGDSEDARRLRAGVRERLEADPRSLPLYEAGSCPFQHLDQAVAASDVLSSVFAVPRPPPCQAALHAKYLAAIADKVAALSFDRRTS